MAVVSNLRRPRRHLPLSPGARNLLNLIREEPGIFQAEAFKRLGLTAGRGSGMVDTLMSQGLAKREPVEIRDTRQWQYVLKPEDGR